MTVAKYCEVCSKLPNYMLRRGKFHAMSIFPNEKEKEARKWEGGVLGLLCGIHLEPDKSLSWYPEWTFWCNGTCWKKRVYTEG